MKTNHSDYAYRLGIMLEALKLNLKEEAKREDRAHLSYCAQGVRVLIRETV